jgi:hypothetical protein
MNVPGHFPLLRASTASTIVDGALNQSITRETTSENDSTQSEWENETFGEIRFGDMQRQQSVRALEEQNNILIWIREANESLESRCESGIPTGGIYETSHREPQS